MFAGFSNSDGSVVCSTAGDLVPTPKVVVVVVAGDVVFGVEVVCVVVIGVDFITSPVEVDGVVLQEKFCLTGGVDIGGVVCGVVDIVGVVVVGAIVGFLSVNTIGGWNGGTAG